MSAPDENRSPLSVRPLVALSAAFTVGIACGTTLFGAILLTGCAATISAIALVTRRPIWQAAALLSLFAAAGAFREYAWSQPGAQDPSRFITAGFVTVEGTVAGEPELGKYDVRFDLRIHNLTTPDGRFIKSDGLAAAHFGRAANTPIPRYGDRIAARGRLESPEPARNPGGFDYADYLAHRGIFTAFTARRPNDWQLNPTASGIDGWLPRLAASARASLLRALDRVLPHAEAGVLAGILLGQRTDLPPELGDDFSATGTAHILATAGLHVGAVLLLLLGVGRLLWIPRRIAVALALLGLALYTVMAGARPSVLRADLMATLLLGGMLLDREGDGPSALAAAALILLAVQPGYLFDAGFQLSFATVGTILAVMPLFAGVLERVRALRGPSKDRATRLSARIIEVLVTVCALTLAAQLGSAPLTAQYFNQVAIVGLAANGLIVPILVLVIAAGFAAWPLSLVWLGAGRVFAALVLSPLLAYIIGVARTCALLPGANIYVPSPGWRLIACYYAALGAGIWWLRTRGATEPIAEPVFEAVT